MKMSLSISAIALVLITTLSEASLASEKSCFPVENGVIENLIQLNEIDICKDGDVISITIPTLDLKYSDVASQICDFSKQILVEPYIYQDDENQPFQSLKYTYLTCVFKYRDLRVQQ